MVFGQLIRYWLDVASQDLHYGFRTLRRTPLSTVVMVASLYSAASLSRFFPSGGRSNYSATSAAAGLSPMLH